MAVDIVEPGLNRFAGLPELEIIGAAQGGDPDALTQLYFNYHSRISSIGYNMLGNYWDAQDLASEMFLKMKGILRSFNEQRGSFATLALRSATYLGIDEQRKRRARPQTYDLLTEAQEIQFVGIEKDPQEVALENERKQRVRRALGQLPPLQAEALTLAYYEGLSHSEIAQRLHWPLGSAKTRVRLGLQKMRELLIEGESPPEVAPEALPQEKPTAPEDPYIELLNTPYGYGQPEEVFFGEKPQVPSTLWMRLLNKISEEDSPISDKAFDRVVRVLAKTDQRIGLTGAERNDLKQELDRFLYMPTERKTTNIRNQTITDLFIAASTQPDLLAQRRSLLTQAIDQLPEQQRRVMQLEFIGMNYDEIIQRLGLSFSAVKHARVRGYDALEELLPIMPGLKEAGLDASDVAKKLSVKNQIPVNKKPKSTKPPKPHFNPFPAKKFAAPDTDPVLNPQLENSLNGLFSKYGLAGETKGQMLARVINSTNGTRAAAKILGVTKPSIFKYRRALGLQEAV